MQIWKPTDSYMYFPSALFFIYYFKFLSKTFKSAQKKIPAFSSIVSRVSNPWKAHSFLSLLYVQEKHFFFFSLVYLFTALTSSWEINFSLGKEIEGVPHRYKGSAYKSPCTCKRCRDQDSFTSNSTETAFHVLSTELYCNSINASRYKSHPRPQLFCSIKTNTKLHWMVTGTQSHLKASAV